MYTLPVIRMLADGHPDGERLSRLLGEPLDDDRRDQARAIVVDGPEIATSVDTAQGYVSDALDALAPLDATPTVIGLRARGVESARDAAEHADLRGCVAR